MTDETEYDDFPHGDVVSSHDLKGLTFSPEIAQEIEDATVYGEVGLIADNYFKEYAQNLAEDIGAILRVGEWPAYCIDWDWAARELQMDYTSVQIDGHDYWIS